MSEQQNEASQLEHRCVSEKRSEGIEMESDLSEKRSRVEVTEEMSESAGI